MQIAWRFRGFLQTVRYEDSTPYNINLRQVYAKSRSEAGYFNGRSARMHLESDHVVVLSC